MFRKNPGSSRDDDADRNRRRAPNEERRVAAWIGPSVVIQGNVNSSEDMTIVGQVEGDVSVPEHMVIVAKGAQIRGNIVARAVVMQGEVHGTITVSGRVEVADTGRVKGDIVAPRAIVQEGGMLNGTLTITAPEPALR